MTSFQLPANPRIMFMGSPDFAVPILQALHAGGYQVVQVITQPDRPRGRGRKHVAGPVKTAALELGIDVLQPPSLKAQAVIQAVAAIKPDLFVVVAFGHVLSPAILRIPKYGAINVHASLLPELRGAAPIHRAIINGATQTGITTMCMDAGLDTGDMLLRSAIDILPQDTAGSLHDRLAHLGAHALIDTLRQAQAAGGLLKIAQDHTQASWAPMLKKSDGLINWNQSAEAIERFIRGMTPWPGAHTFFGSRRLKIFKAHVLDMEMVAPPGTIVQCFPEQLRIATAKGALSIEEIQSASGKRLAIRDFVCGCKIPEGAVLGKSAIDECLL